MTAKPIKICSGLGISRKADGDWIIFQSPNRATVMLNIEHLDHMAKAVVQGWFEGQLAERGYFTMRYCPRCLKHVPACELGENFEHNPPTGACGAITI